MTAKDFLGILLFAAGIFAAALRQPVFGLDWYWAALALVAAGLLCIWSAQRQRRIDKATGQTSGDWDGGYLSSSHASDYPDLDD